MVSRSSTLHPVEKSRLGYWYLALSTSFGLVFALLMPPSAVPDESVHFLRAYDISRGKLVPEKLDQWGGSTIPDGIAAVSRRFIPVIHNGKARVTFEDFRALGTYPFSPAGVPATRVSFQGAAIYPFFSYLPQAIGVATGRALGMGPLGLFYLGRVGGAAFSIFLTWLALMCLPCFEGALFLVALLPTTVQQFSSFSTDAVSISASFLLFAVLMRLVLGDEARAGKRELFLLFGAGALVALTKFPFATTALLFAAISADKLGGRARRAWMGLALFSMIAVLAYLAARHAGRFTPTETSYPGYPVSTGEQLRHVLTHPFQFIGVCLHSISSRGLSWIRALFTLGYLDAPVRGELALAYVTLLFLVVLGGKESLPGIPRRARYLAGLAGALSVGMILGSQYLVWTRVGASAVEGIQGRYFIPCLPLLLLPLYGRVPALRQLRFHPRRLAPWIAILMELTAAGTILGRYYL